MRLLPTYAALAAGSASAISVFPKSITSKGIYDRAKILVSSPGNLWVFNYDGAELQPTLNLSIAGAPTWAGLVEEDRLYTVDPGSSSLTEYNLDTYNSILEPLYEADSRPELSHLAFNQDATRLVASAAFGNGVEVWDISDGLATKIKDVSIGDEHAWSGSNQAVLDPTGRYFFVSNLGTIDITVIDTKDDAYTIASTIGVGYSYCEPIAGVFYPPGAAVATHYIASCYSSAYGSAVQLYALTYKENSIRADIKGYELTFEWSSNVTHYGLGGQIIAVDDDVYIATGDSTEKEDLIIQFKMEQRNGTMAIRRESRTLVGGLDTSTFALTDDGKDLLVANRAGENAITVLRRKKNGRLHSKPVATVPMSFFGPNEDDGPLFIGQVGRD